MTKTEAAKMIATDVRVWARRNDYPAVTFELCEARVSEWRHPNYDGTYLHDAAMIANPKTVYRLATQYSL